MFFLNFYFLIIFYHIRVKYHFKPNSMEAIRDFTIFYISYISIFSLIFKFSISTINFLSVYYIITLNFYWQPATYYKSWLCSSSAYGRSIDLCSSCCFLLILVNFIDPCVSFYDILSMYC